MANETETWSQEQISALLDLAAERAKRYVRDVTERRVGSSEAAVSALAGLHESFPQ